jgi:FeS assembly protein SufD
MPWTLENLRILDRPLLDASSPIQAEMGVLRNRLKSTPLPTRKTESWRYTSLKNLESKIFSTENLNLNVKSNSKISQSNDVVQANSIRKTVCSLNIPAVFTAKDLASFKEKVDGSCLRLHSLKELDHAPSELVEWVKQNLAKSQDYFSLLNLNHNDDALIIEVLPEKDGKNETEKSFEIINDFTLELLNSWMAPTEQQEQKEQHEKNFVQPLVWIYLHPGSTLKLIEKFSSQSIGFVNALTRVSIGKGAELTYLQLSCDDVNTWHSHKVQIDLRERAKLTHLNLAVGGSTTRSELEVNLCEPHATATLLGLYLAQDTQHIDMQTTLNHKAPECITRQHYKGVLNGSARGVFGGRIYIAPEAQKTDSALLNKNLMLSPRAEVNTKPELEVYADDVKASHGATIGQLRADEIFYFESRAISRAKAMALITSGFINDIVLQLPDIEMQNFVQANLTPWMERLLKDRDKDNDNDMSAVASATPHLGESL